MRTLVAQGAQHGERGHRDERELSTHHYSLTRQCVASRTAVLSTLTDRRTAAVLARFVSSHIESSVQNDAERIARLPKRFAMKRQHQVAIMQNSSRLDAARCAFIWPEKQTHANRPPNASA